MSLLTQAYLLEKYGPRLSLEQVAEVLGFEKQTVYHRISRGDLGVRTYVDGGRRWADARDVAEAFDEFRKLAA